MTRAASFLQAILDNPDDDTPRLVFADWLEEHDQAGRAEFIHVQCELAHSAADDPRRPAWQQREQGLLQEHGANWRREVTAWARQNARFIRGFIGAIKSTATAFLRGAGGLFHRAPVQEVQLGNVTNDHLVRLAGSPHLARQADISVGGRAMSSYECDLVDHFLASRRAPPPGTDRP